MKVHIAYDDGTLVGVYRKRGDAKSALIDKAIAVTADLVGSGPMRATTLTQWAKCAGGIERVITYDPNGRASTWEQWIDTHEVTK